jgi:predicted amidophosphoribosyltransferase
VGPPDGIDAWAAAFAYEGVAREVVARVKYRNVRAVVPWLAGRMVAAATDAGLAEVDAAVWAPTTAERRRRRGFDAAELLARAVARRLHVPAAALLERLPGPPQTGLVGAARRVGPGFTARQGVPGAVVLVDDVATTGATLAAAARALRATGARCVVAVTAARTPAPGDGPIGSCVYSAEGADS